MTETLVLERIIQLARIGIRRDSIRQRSYTSEGNNCSQHWHEV